jgi:cellulose synthase operon protein B
MNSPLNSPFFFRRWTSFALLSGLFSASLGLTLMQHPSAFSAPAPGQGNANPVNPGGAKSDISSTNTVSSAGSKSEPGGKSEIVPMKLLKVIDTIYLPTVSSERRLEFTKPKTWSLLPTSRLHVEFQHSHELLPNRSWLKVLINEREIKHIPLTHANAEGTSLDIPLPTAILKDLNTLRYRVEQHYTDVCEDPLEPSLWTQILPTSKLIFDYKPALPNVNLAEYPYPVVDPLTYSPVQIKYLTPNLPAVEETHALALVNLSLAHAAQKKEMHTQIASKAGSQSVPGEHIVVVGTPADNPQIAQYASRSGDFSLQGASWINKKTGQPISDGEGVVLFLPDTAVQGRAVLVVSGNSPAGVLNAAKYISTPGAPKQNPGNGYLVSSGWSSNSGSTQRKPRFVDTQNRSFKELELITEREGYQEVHKIYAPPITYKVPIVGDFRKGNAKMFLDLVYSYGPGMNEEFSSLELRMNAVSIGNIPLINPNGEERVRATIPISNELLKPRSELVAQFHMMPNKFGRCKNTFVDKAWGRIHDDSQFRVEGGVEPKLPDLIYLGDIGYPYSKKENLEETHFLVPKQPNPAVLKALLGFTTRLGRNLKSDTDFRFTVSEIGSSLPSDRDIIAIEGTGNDTVRTGNLQNQFELSWPLSGLTPNRKQFLNQDKSKNLFQDDGMAAYLEQRANPNTSRMITTISSRQDAGLLSLAKLFENDEAKAWETLNSGSLKQWTTADEDLNTAEYPMYRVEQEKNPMVPQKTLVRDTGWFSSISTVQFLLVFCAFFVLLIVSPIILRSLKGKKRPRQ